MKERQAVLDKLDRIELFLTEERMKLLHGSVYKNESNYCEWEAYLLAGMTVRRLGREIKGEKR